MSSAIAYSPSLALLLSVAVDPDGVVLVLKTRDRHRTIWTVTVADLILHKHGHMNAFLTRTLRSAAIPLALTTVVATAQTRVTPPKNNYQPSEDVELGR